MPEVLPALDPEDPPGPPVEDAPALEPPTADALELAPLVAELEVRADVPTQPVPRAAVTTPTDHPRRTGPCGLARRVTQLGSRGAGGRESKGVSNHGQVTKPERPVRVRETLTGKIQSRVRFRRS